MRSPGLIALLALFPSCGCASLPDPGEATDAGIDHIILGVGDLDSGIAEMERRTGVRATYGGSHPGAGTRNALISLGPTVYLEILAPDPAQHVDDPEVRALRAMTRLKPIGWAVQPESAEAFRMRLERIGFVFSDATSASRARPDGIRLEGFTFALTRPEHALAPFFIRWSAWPTHPARTSPPGCRFRSLTLSAADPQALERIVRPLDVQPVLVRRAARSDIRLSLSCPRGRVVFH